MNNYNETFIEYFRKYIKYDFAKERKSWAWVLKYYLALIILGLFLIALVFYFLQVFPPKATYLAVSQEGTSTHQIALSFKKFFSKNGLDLSLVTTNGREDGFMKLRDDGSKVKAGFYLQGEESEEVFNNFRSLGSIQMEPIWIFYRGNEIVGDDPIAALAGKKVAIGLPETSSNRIFKTLAQGKIKSTASKIQLKELSYEESEAQLTSGQVDAFFIVNGFDSTVIQSLISRPDVKIYNFNLADAYIKKYPYLEKLVIPRGSFNLDQVLPKKDITLLGYSANLLVEKDVHPAIQWAYILAMRQYGRLHTDFFAKYGEFPKDQDFDLIPLSSVAERYFSVGVPQVFNIFPIWLASLIDGIWIQVVAFILLAYPILLKLFGVRSFTSRKIMNDSYSYLKHLREKGRETGEISELKNIIAQLHALELNAKTVWSSNEDAKDYIELDMFTKEILEELQGRLIQLEESLVRA